MKNVFAIWILVTFASGQVAHAQSEKVRSVKKTIGILPTEDRWISLTDGSKVYQGSEISYLLVSNLVKSKKYNTIFLSSEDLSADASSAKLSATSPEWVRSAAQAQGSMVEPMEITVQPIVETLIYTSGDRSDRIVFGFSPEHLNPFNQGKEGALDNEFVSTAQQQKDCVLPDFFNGEFTPNGWGPTAGNFGSNLDQGASFQIAGYGLSFKKMSFQIKSQIRFVINNLKEHTHHELVFKTTGSGNDVFVSGSYQGYSLGLTIQRRNTLLQALNQLLPQIVSKVVAVGFEPPVKTHSLAVQASSTSASGDVVSTIENEINLLLDPTKQAATQMTALKNCFNKSTVWIEDVIDSAALPYALWKYETVLDQPFKASASVMRTDMLQSSSKNVLKIAIIDSGVDYNDSVLKNHIQVDANGQVDGYDFISDDVRPSDDNGHGTAAAKYLAQVMGSRPFNILPIKAIGSHGETHSSAIYDSFAYAVAARPNAILVPWTSSSTTQTAVKMGQALATKYEIPVFMVPAGKATTTAPSGATTKTAATSSAAAYNVHGLGGAYLTLDTQGAATITNLVKSITTP